MPTTTNPRLAKCGARRLRHMAGLKQFLFANVVFAAMPVAKQNPGRSALVVPRQQQITRHSGSGPIVEREFLHDKIAAILS